MINTINKYTHTDKIRFTELASIIIVGMSSLVLSGWLFDILLFRSLFPALAPMNPMTALTFISAAFSLWLSGNTVFNRLSSFRRKLLAQIFAGMVCIVGTIKIIDTYTSLEIEIDRLLFQDKLETIPIGAPNLMAVSTAFCFILCGLSLLLLNYNKKNNDYLAQFLLSIVLAICLLSLVGYLYTLGTFGGISQFITMSFITASMFVLLGIAILWICPDQWFFNTLLSKHMGGTVARNLLPMAIIFPLSIGWLGLELQSRFSFTYELGVGTLVVSIVVIFTFIILRHARSLNRIDRERKQAENKIEELLNHTQAVNEELVASEEELRQHLANTLELNKKLAESESRLAETQQIAHVGSWEYDIVSQQSKWSKEIFHIFGLECSAKAPAYEEYMGSIHPNDREKIMEAATIAFTEAKAYELELRILRPDTTERWIQIIGKPVINEEAKVIKIIGITRDITESKLSEIALLESENRYRKLVELLPDGIIVNHQEHIIYANPAALAMFASQAPEELYGKEIMELIHPDYHHLVANHIQQVSLGKSAAPLEQILVRLDKGTFEAELSATLLNHTTRTLLILIRDITERKKAERSIAESEQFFKALFQNSSDYVQTIDATGKVLYQSPTFYKLTGYTFQERAGKSIFELFHPEDKQAAREFLQKVAAHPGQSMVHELRILHKNGTVQWAEATVTNLLNEPFINAFVANSRNITERKMAEEQLKDQNNELRKINAELDRFVYRASHDLRAPLASILGLITISKTESNDNIKTQYLDLMTKSINKLDVFIQSIINYSRNARLEVKGKPIDFDLLIQETFDDLRYMERNDQIEKQLHISGKATFLSDEFRLKIIFSNIISNAIRYSNPRVNSFLNINIEIDEKKVWITFTDNGYGIAQENLDKIFDMFYRASYNNEGSGLGLYIVKEVVQTLGGSIQVTSVLGEGTTFLLNLPNQADPAVHIK